MYKLKNKKGRVNYLLKSGKDFVSSSMSITAAEYIVEHGKTVDSIKPDYPICIDNEWYFEGVEVKTRKAEK